MLKNGLMIVLVKSKHKKLLNDLFDKGSLDELKELLDIYPETLRPRIQEMIDSLELGFDK